MLENDGALDAPRSARFGQGSGNILRVECYGTEENLADCPRIWTTSSCGHRWDAGAVCYSGAHPQPFKVRLVNGSNDAEGRVEVMYEGSWGTICDNGWWDLRDARVVCRMLGFDGALDAPGSARFGQSSGRILLIFVGCEGTEDNLADCAHPEIGNYCGHSRDAGAICYSEESTITIEFETADPSLSSSTREELSTELDIRLVNGSSNAEGRVEVLYGVSWMTVCDNYWNLLKARVVCRMRGFDGALEAPGSARFGQGTGDILYVWGCVGTEESLADCGHRTITSCRHHEDAGAVCYSGAHPNPFEVRLINGSNDAEGRVEVLHDGSWGTICHYGWDLRDVRVVCRMLGFDGALNAPTSARFGQGSGHILLAWVECDGTEDNLVDCAHRGIGDYNVRLVNGSNDAEGRVKVLYSGSWMTICDRYWDLLEARVVCRMRGFDGALEAPGSARFGEGTGDSIVVDCYGTEESLADCPYLETVSWCGHHKDAGAVCYSGAHPNPFEVRLINGSNDAEGRLEVMHGGSWGTICDDLWDLRDARVVCRMLGFDGALDAPGSARFG
eukprot:XP_011666467.1 PREDICTED: deleted in malignant brain tumors 1 protein-like [Strongylocentrotus purpuratus]